MTLGANDDPVGVAAATEHHKEMRRFDGIAIALGGVALVALAWTVRSIINPFIAAFVLYVVLARFRQYRSARSLMTTGFVLFGLWLVLELAGILVPFIIGAVLAYLFNPLVTKLKEKRRISRTWSSLTIVILFLGVLVAIGWLLLPSLGQQTKAFIALLTEFIRQNANTFDEPHLRQLFVDLGLPAGLVDQVIMKQAAPELRKIIALVPTVIMEIIAGLPRILERTLNLIIVPVAMFYFLKDWPKLMPIVDSLFPSKHLARRTAVLADVDHVLYGYVRGQATVAVLVGILAAIAYSILGIPYAGLLGVILAVSDLVPIVGMIFSAFIVELVIFLTMQLNFAVIASGILVIVGLHMLEVYIIGPRIIGQGIGVPPILMILALLVFGFFFGFIGLLIAVPTTGIILLFLNEYRKNNAGVAG
ncbi:MAG: AI-2E family transporter [Candidatus Kapaibacterium sp.]